MAGSTRFSRNGMHESQGLTIEPGQHPGAIVAIDALGVAWGLDRLRRVAAGPGFVDRWPPRSPTSANKTRRQWRAGRGIVDSLGSPSFSLDNARRHRLPESVSYRPRLWRSSISVSPVSSLARVRSRSIATRMSVLSVILSPALPAR